MEEKMIIPMKIYLHEASVEQLAEPRKDYHLEYISKDALLEWIKDNRKTLLMGQLNESTSRRILAYDLLEDKLNSI